MKRMAQRYLHRGLSTLFALGALLPCATAQAQNTTASIRVEVTDEAGKPIGGLPVTITNCANNYGAYQFPEKVVPFFTTQALQDLQLPMYASTQNRREWIHALDHCSAIDLVLSKGRIGETYHVGTGVDAKTMTANA